MNICNEFPEFRKHLLQRAKIRRCHWKKVFEENRHYCLLKQKEQAAREANLQNDPKVNRLFDAAQLDTESELELELMTEEEITQQKVFSLLNKEFDIFRRSARDKKYDPMELKNRVSYMAGDYLEIENYE